MHVNSHCDIVMHLPGCDHFSSDCAKRQSQNVCLCACVCMCLCVCACVCACTSLVPAIKSSQLSVFLAGGLRGCRGAPSNEALQPRKTYLHRLRLGPVVGSWRGTHLRSPFISFRDVARGRNLTPDGSSHLVLHAILDVRHAWHRTSIS